MQKRNPLDALLNRFAMEFTNKALPFMDAVSDLRKAVKAGEPSSTYIGLTELIIERNHDLGRGLVLAGGDKAERWETVNLTINDLSSMVRSQPVTDQATLLAAIDELINQASAVIWR